MLSRMVSRSLMSGQSPMMAATALTRRAFAAAAAPVEKGEERVEGRLDGLMMTDDEIDKHLQTHFDEEGSYKPPHMDTFVSMSRRDVMMNVRIPPLGIEPPPFGEEQIREITEKREWKADWTDC